MSRPIRLLLTLLEMNWKEFARDRAAAFFSFGFPLLFLLLFGFTSSYRSSVKLVLGLVDLDKSPASERLIKIIEERHFVFVRSVSQPEGTADLNRNKISALLVIPLGSLEENATEPLKIVAGPGSVEWIRVTMDAILADSVFRASHVLSKPQYELVEQRRTSSEFTYIFPGLLALALLNLGIFGTANPLLRARDRGTLRHLAVTPVSTGMILQGQVLLRLIIATVQLALLLVVGRLLFKVSVAGDNWILFAFLFIGAVMLIAMGYAIAGAAPSQESGGVIILLVEFGLMFLGQVFVDFSSIPGLSTVVKLIPLTYLSDGCRQALLGVPGMFSLRVDFAMLMLWTSFLLFAAIRTFRFDMEAR